jgi:hypothetical protein
MRDEISALARALSFLLGGIAYGKLPQERRDRMAQANAYLGRCPPAVLPYAVERYLREVGR